MVLPGTFMPFFFPLGIAFMGSQSAVMMKMAGEQWQYGKRRISAMDNKDFNKLTPQNLFQLETEELRAMIPLIQESMRDMNQLTPIIVSEMVTMFKQFVEGLYSAANEAGAEIFHPFFNFILQSFGLPTKNLAGSFGFGTNTQDKFQPPFTPGSLPGGNTQTTSQIVATQQQARAKAERGVSIETKYATKDYDQSIVGKGLNLTQLNAAIKRYDGLIVNAKKRTTTGTHASQTSYKRKVTLYTKAREEYIKACRYVLAQGRSSATT